MLTRLAVCDVLSEPVLQPVDVNGAAGAVGSPILCGSQIDPKEGSRGKRRL